MIISIKCATKGCSNITFFDSNYCEDCLEKEEDGYILRKRALVLPDNAELSDMMLDDVAEEDEEGEG